MLQSIAKFFLYASVFAVVVVLPGTFFPFIGGKYYFFRVMTEMALMFSFFWWAFEAKQGEIWGYAKKLFNNPLVLAVTFFVFTYMLAVIFSYNPNAAFWSNYERGDGGFQMLHYYAFFILSLLLFRVEKDWNRLFFVSLIASLLMIFYGIAAIRGFEGFVGPYEAGIGFWFSVFNIRFQGSLGNPAYVAPYLMFSLFYTIWLFFIGKIKWERAIPYAFLACFFLLFFFASQTRGAFVGLFAAVFFAALYLLFSNRRLRLWAGGFLLVIVLSYGILYHYRQALIDRNVFGARFLEIGLSADSLQTRLWTWGSAVRGFKERPILGWGPENFTVVFDKYFDPRHFNPNQSTETWFDRAHSLYFDALAETGIVGLTGFLSVFVVFFTYFFKYQSFLFSNKNSAIGQSISHKHVLRRSVLGAAFFALPLGYLVQGLALFDVLPIYLNLFLFLGFSSFLFLSVQSSDIQKTTVSSS